MIDRLSENAIYDEEGINYDDIPEITNFSKARKNPFADKLKNGYTIVVEHEDYEEVVKVKKTRRKKNLELWRVHTTQNAHLVV